MEPELPLLIAGATGYGVWPANSLEGLRRCLDARFDGVEIDALASVDGHVVAHHDWRLDPDQTRLDGAWMDAPSAPLKSMPLEEIRRYDLGRPRPGSDHERRYPERRPLDGVRVPTLPEMLDAMRAARGPRRLLYVEIKTHPTKPDEAPQPEMMVEAVIRDLEAADWLDHAKIIAFDWQILRLTRERAPQLCTAHLTIPRPATAPPVSASERRSPWADGFDPRDHEGSELRAIKAHGGMEWSPYFTEVTSERIDEARALDLRVGPWGLSRGEDIRRMAAFGVFSSTVSGAEWP